MTDDLASLTQQNVCQELRDQDEALGSLTDGGYTSEATKMFCPDTMPDSAPDPTPDYGTPDAGY